MLYFHAIHNAIHVRHNRFKTVGGDSGVVDLKGPNVLH